MNERVRKMLYKKPQIIDVGITEGVYTASGNGNCDCFTYQITNQNRSTGFYSTTFKILPVESRTICRKGTGITACMSKSLSIRPYLQRLPFMPVTLMSVEIRLSFILTIFLLHMMEIIPGILYSSAVQGQKISRSNPL
jgi:hypothetical protein